MNNSILRKLLSDLPLFLNLSDDEYRILAFIGRRQEFNAGDFLYDSSTEVDGASLLIAGRVKVVFEAMEKPDIVLRRGVMMNELSLFSARYPTYSLNAMEKVSIMHFSRDDFMNLMEQFPEIAHKLQQNIASRLGDFSAAFDRA